MELYKKLYVTIYEKAGYFDIQTCEVEAGIEMTHHLIFIICICKYVFCLFVWFFLNIL